jgi:hypothetical protein
MKERPTDDGKIASRHFHSHASDLLLIFCDLPSQGLSDRVLVPLATFSCGPRDFWRCHWLVAHFHVSWRLTIHLGITMIVL